MKILFWADLHAHCYQEFSELDEGVNSRLMECVKAVNSVREAAEEHKVDYIGFGGDVLHLKNFADIQVVRYTIEAFKRLCAVAPMFICAGNHDYRSWNREPVLIEAMSGLLEDAKFVEIADLKGDWHLHVFNYRRDISELTELLAHWNYDPKAIGLFHQDVIGSRYGGIEVVKGLDAAMLSKKFRWSFVGHYHTPRQYVPNVFSIGAPLAHNFSDAGEDHGWWILDTESENPVEFVPNFGSPQFIDVELRENDEKLISEGLVPFAGRPDHDYFRIKSHLKELPDIIKALKWKRVAMAESETDKKSRADLKFSDTEEALMRKYIKVKNPGLDEERLVTLGRRYL